MYDVLAELAERENRQRFEDLYFLNGDPFCSTKVRHSRLKVKRLEDEHLGFQRWSTTWYKTANESPAPFDRVLFDLQRCRPDSTEYAAAVGELLGKDKLDGVWRPLLVTKNRRRFRIGSIKAEATTVQVSGAEPSATVAIEGPDIAELVDLRDHLGLGDVPNLALHLAVDPLHAG